MKSGTVYDTRVTVVFMKSLVDDDVVMNTAFTKITPVSAAFIEADGAISLTGFATTIAVMTYALAF